MVQLMVQLYLKHCTEFIAVIPDNTGNQELASGELPSLGYFLPRSFCSLETRRLSPGLEARVYVSPSATFFRDGKSDSQDSIPGRSFQQRAGIEAMSVQDLVLHAHTHFQSNVNIVDIYYVL